MERRPRQVPHNISHVVARPESPMKSLRAPLPAVPASAATLRHACRHYFPGGGVSNAGPVVTCAGAAELAAKPVAAVRQPVHRRRRLTKTGYILGRERKGVCYALRDGLGWSRENFEVAARRAEAVRRVDLGFV